MEMTMTLLDIFNKQKESWKPEQFSKPINKNLSDLEELFESKSLKRIQNGINHHSGLIRKDGEILHRNHGLAGMQEVHRIISESSSVSARNLSTIWDGVGDWTD